MTNIRYGNDQYNRWGCIKVNCSINWSIKANKGCSQKTNGYVREPPIKMLSPLFGRTLRNNQYKRWSCIKVDEMKAVSNSDQSQIFFQIQYEARRGEPPSRRLGKVLKAEFSDWGLSYSSYQSIKWYGGCADVTWVRFDINLGQWPSPHNVHCWL